MLAERAAIDVAAEWPDPPEDPLGTYVAHLSDCPWALGVPILVGAGRFTAPTEHCAGWWMSDDGRHTLPLAEEPAEVTLGSKIERAAGIWNGARLELLAAHADWGRLAL